MDVIKLILKYYDEDSELYRILVRHSENVSKKALSIAKKFIEKNPSEKIDLNFIHEASMLHDIGIFKTNFHLIGCFGNANYIEHGVLGGEILRQEGLIKHAHVAERHTGLGLSKEDIIHQNLPLPHKDFLPITVEEEIIALADKFYTKIGDLDKEADIDSIRLRLAKYGKHRVDRFDQFLKKYM